jgi:hypothetical protein
MAAVVWNYKIFEIKTISRIATQKKSPLRIFLPEFVQAVEPQFLH